jgi:GntR family transcriptional regulator / MocR family aminotransferase
MGQTLRPWKTNLVIDFTAGLAVYLQIARGIIEEIRKGRLGPGTPLPGSRILADDLGVNRKTVMLAYSELIAQGWLEAQGKRGTFVSYKIPETKPVDTGSSKINAFAKTSFLYPKHNICLAPEHSLPGLIVFTDGTPDVRLAPIHQLGRAYRSVMIGKGRRNRLDYSDPSGSLVLREAISQMLGQDRGLTATAQNICITRGSQMALYLVAQALIEPGDVVVVDELSYPPAWQAFRHARAQIVTVPLDNEGTITDEIEKLCLKKKVKAVFTTPHHQFPTTVTLRPERRLQLLELAARYGFAIVEDDYDHEFHFSHKPVLPLASADQHGSVIYLGSLSKLIAPGVRIGYVAAPRELIEEIKSIRAIVDRQGDPVLEESVADLMQAGEIYRHARKAFRIYQQRRELFARLMREQLGDRVSFQVPDGGLAFWVNFHGIAVDTLFSSALENKVSMIPGSYFSFDKKIIPASRLGFASLKPEELEEGVKRLRKLM